MYMFNFSVSILILKYHVDKIFNAKLSTTWQVKIVNNVQVMRSVSLPSA